MSGFICSTGLKQAARKSKIMHYISTRGQAPALGFEDVLLAGLASDGGLYVPETWPQVDAAALAGKSYHDIAMTVMKPFIGGEIPDDVLRSLIEKAYATFRDRRVTPLVELDQDVWLMELFHGPTLAFKDVALQLLGHLFDHVLSKKKQHITVVGATSGDTGSAAIEACRDKETMDIFILHPHGRVSEVQRRQMTTVLSSNVHNIAVEGSFDDCQDIVKALFNDHKFRADMNLAAINSINWARIMAQVVYYFVAAAKTGSPVSFSVPTGNFGNVYAAYVAKKMGLPVEKLIVGTNRNDILHRFFETGTMRKERVAPTLSPSMDIQISSNFERLLFELCNRDAGYVRGLTAGFAKDGAFDVEAGMLAQAKKDFCSWRLDDEKTLNVIREVYENTGQVVDPHTAVGLGAALHYRDKISTPLVSLACAHPAKFPDAVEKAIGVRPSLPDFLSDLYARPERCEIAPANVEKIKSIIAAKSGREAGKCAKA